MDDETGFSFSDLLPQDASMGGPAGPPVVTGPAMPTPPIPPRPMGPAVPAGIAPFLLALPAILRGRAGGMSAAAAFLQGIQQAHQLRGQQDQRVYQNQTQQFEQQRQLVGDQRAQAQQQANADWRAQQIKQQQLARQDALMKEAIGAMGSAESPEAIDALMGLYQARAQGLGLSDVSPMQKAAETYKSPTRMQKKAAEKYIAGLEKTYGQDWAVKTDGATFTLPGAPIDPATGKPQAITGQELLGLAGLNITRMPQKPLRPDPLDAETVAAGQIGLITKPRDQWTQADWTALQRQIAGNRPRTGDSMSDVRRFNMEQKLVTQWDKARSSEREMERQYGLMETGLRRFDADPNGASQAVLVTFQKVLDPTSVVRESEYARSSAGISLLSRMQGYQERLARGGAGVPKRELEEMVRTAKEFLDGARRGNQGLRSRIQRTTADYKLDPRMIFDDPDQASNPAGSPEPAPTPQPPSPDQPAAPNGRVVYQGGGVTIREKAQ